MFKKVFPPAGYFVSPVKLLPALFSSQTISSAFPGYEVYSYNSAKAALFILFKSLKALGNTKPVAVSAFTCPDIVSAILKAGMKVKLLDVEPNDVRLRVTYDKVKDCSAVVLSNLYGLIDVAEDLQDVFIVDDLCQAALSYIPRSRKSIERYARIYSFGRGKAYSGAGGGILVIEKKNTVLNEMVKDSNKGLPTMSGLEMMTHLLRAAFLWIFGKPRMYLLISMLPFLKLGETNVISKFDCRYAPKLMQKLFFRYKRNAEENVPSVRSDINSYRILFEELPLPAVKVLIEEESEIVIRFPVLYIPKEARNSYCLKNRDYGVSKSYNVSLPEIFPPGTFVNAESNFNNAKSTAEELMTLSLVSQIGEEQRQHLKIEF